MNQNDSQPAAVPAELLGSLNVAAMQESMYLKMSVHFLPLGWRNSLRRLIEAVDSNVAFDEAVSQLRGKMPRDLRSIIDTAVELPEPGRFVLHVAEGIQQRKQLTRGLLAVLAYPTVLLAVSLLFASAASFVLAPVLINLTREFGLTMGKNSWAVVEDQQAASMGLLIVFSWTALVALSIKWIGPRWGSLAVWSGLPYVGKAVCWISLFEIVHRIEGVVEQGLAGIPATQQVAASFVGSPMEYSVEQVFRRCQSGIPIGTSLAHSLLSDGLCAPALLSLDDQASRSQDFSTVARLLRRLSEIRLNNLATTFPFLLFLIIISVVVGTFSSYVGLLFNFIWLLSAF